MNTPSDKKPRLSVEETSRWKFVNQWQVNDQSNDRMPVDSRVDSNALPPSAQRSTARRIINLAINAGPRIGMTEVL